MAQGAPASPKFALTVSTMPRAILSPAPARASGFQAPSASGRNVKSMATSPSLLSRRFKAQNRAENPRSSSSSAPLLCPRRPPSPPLLLRPPRALSSPTDSGGAPRAAAAAAAITASDWRYKLWWSLSVAAATATAFFTPWQLAFGSDAADFYSDPLGSPEAWVEAALALVWLCDVAASFLVAPDAGDASSSSSSYSSTSSGGAVSAEAGSGSGSGRSSRSGSSSTPAAPAAATAATSSAPSLVAANYGRSSTFVLDVVSIVPWDFLAVSLAGGASAAASAGLLPGLALLRLATLGRLHRVRAAFAQLEYDTRLDLLWVTIARNTALVALAAHAAACGFYFAARASGFDAEALVGADRDFLLSLDGGQRYLMSLWWALSTLSSGEYGEKREREREREKDRVF